MTAVAVIGEFTHAIYEASFCDALERAGCHVLRVPVGDLLGPKTRWSSIQDRLVMGPNVRRANERVRKALASWSGVVLAWRTPWLDPAIVERMQLHGVRVALYNNDDPFGPDRTNRRWRKFQAIIPAANVCFVYRDVNVSEFSSAGARQVHVLRSAFDPTVHRPVALSEAERKKYGADVVFIGHCEGDSRLDFMDSLLQSDLRVGLYGTGWERFATGRSWRDRLPIGPLYGDAYVKAIAAAKIALVFLSNRNRDDYTRRCFEIPAIGTLMLAPRTDTLLKMFKEGEEAIYFSSAVELVGKARQYSADEAARTKIAGAGHRRCLADGHDLDSRAREFLRFMTASSR